MRIWCCAELGTAGNEISISMTSLRYLLTFAAMLDNFKSHVFNRHEIRGFNSTLINYCDENDLNKLSANFFFNGGFRESSLRNYKESWALRFTLIHTFSCVLESCECTCVQRLACVQGSFANEWVIKPFLKHPKSSEFVCIKSSLQCMHNLNPISLIAFCETSHSRRHSYTEYVA